MAAARLTPRQHTMNLKELGAKIATDHPNVNARVIDKVLRAAFASLRTELETTTESAVKCGPLGTFKLHEKAAKEGAETADTKRRITLRLAAAKDGSEGAGKAPGKAAKGAKGARAGRVGKAANPADQAVRAEKKAARQAARAAKQAGKPDSDA